MPLRHAEVAYTFACSPTEWRVSGIQFAGRAFAILQEERLRSRELYRSANVAIRLAPGASRRRCVVAFDQHGDCTTLDRPGFGEAFFARHGITAIFVNGCGNHWYQYPDMLAALAKIRDALKICPRVMTYGSGMGGYAAIRFAEHVGATTALALAPHYSCDPTKVRFGTPCAQQGAKIRWRPELDGRIAMTIRPIIVHDPVQDDGRHVAMIAADTPILEIALPDTRPVFAFLEETDMLERLIHDALAGELDPRGFADRARSKAGLRLLTHAG